MRDGDGIPARLDEQDARARIVRHRLQIREVGDHERVARRRRELLHDARDVERDDSEAASRAVERPQLEQITDGERVIADRLLRDEDAVAHPAQALEDVCGGVADEVRVAQARSLRERCGIDPEGVLQVGTDVRVGVIDRRDAGDARKLPDAVNEVVLDDRSRRRARDDVGTEGQLCVDARLLVVRRGEDAEVDAEREQERDHDEAAVDRSAAPARTDEQEARPRARASARRAAGEPGERAAAQPHEQQRRPEPEQGRPEEHVHGEGQRRVRVRVDDRREPGARGECVDEPGAGEREQVEVEALPERFPLASCAAPCVAHAPAEDREARAHACGERARDRERDADPKGDERASAADTAAGAREVHREQGAPRSERAGQKTEEKALDPRETEQVPPRSSARTQQREVPAVALHRSQRGEVRQAERDERAWDGEHDVERLGVERIAGRTREAVAEVVDELHAAGERSLDPVPSLRRPLERSRRASAERMRIDLGLHLPLDARLRSGDRRGARVDRCDGTQRRCNVMRERRQRQNRDVRGRLCGSGADEWVERLEEDVRRRDDRDAADAERARFRSRSRLQDDLVAGLHAQRRRQLLVEDDLPRLQRPAQEPEGLDVVQIAGRHGEDRAGAGGNRPGGSAMLRACERCRGYG